jgi:DNA invertase Pin-like site-specific DNA recombinase
MRTAIYERISQDKTGEAAGVTRQDEDCRALAADLGWQIVEIYIDNDVSATSGKPRPAYRRMLADIEAGRIDGIISWHTDRLYRTMRDIEELVSVVEGHRLAIRTCRAGELDLSTPTGKMLARILGSVAQHEVEQKADRWQRSVRQRRQAGRWWNSARRMFGYTRDGEIVVEEAEALRKVAEMILSGSTSHAACQWLQDEGMRTTRGNDWQPSSLRVTLRSPKVAALSALDGQIVGQGEWEPILDRATWERLVAAPA